MPSVVVVVEGRACGWRVVVVDERTRVVMVVNERTRVVVVEKWWRKGAMHLGAVVEKRYGERLRVWMTEGWAVRVWVAKGWALQQVAEGML
jgi:hypothetical protein